MITEHLIKRQSGEYDPEIIRRLRLENCGITLISNLHRCSSLIDLSLSMNEIGEISGLDSLVNLQKLDLSFNRITRLANLSGLFSLVWLDLKCNRISDDSEATSLAPLVNMKFLVLFCDDSTDNNPVCLKPNYRKDFLDALPQLDFFDGSHASLEHSTTILESKLENIVPDPKICSTPPLEPWLKDNTSVLDVDTSDISSIFEHLQSSIEETKSALSIDCNRLLENSKKALSKAAIAK